MEKSHVTISFIGSSPFSARATRDAPVTIPFNPPLPGILPSTQTARPARVTAPQGKNCAFSALSSRRLAAPPASGLRLHNFWTARLLFTVSMSSLVPNTDCWILSHPCPESSILCRNSGPIGVPEPPRRALSIGIPRSAPITVPAELRSKIRQRRQRGTCVSVCLQSEVRDAAGDRTSDLASSQKWTKSSFP